MTCLHLLQGKWVCQINWYQHSDELATQKYIQSNINQITLRSWLSSSRKTYKVNKRVNYKAVDTSSENLPCNLFAKFRINYSIRMEKLSVNHIKLRKIKLFSWTHTWTYYREYKIRQYLEKYSVLWGKKLHQGVFLFCFVFYFSVKIFRGHCRIPKKENYLCRI